MRGDGGLLASAHAVIATTNLANVPHESDTQLVPTSTWNKTEDTRNTRFMLVQNLY